MDNKKIDILFGLVVIAFLFITIMMIRDFKAQRLNDYKEFSTRMNNVVKIENYRIKMLIHLLAVERKENEDLRDTLSETRNSLDGLSKKLSQPASIAAPK